MDDFEIFRKLAMCEDKEQMQRCIDEYNLIQKPMTNADRIRAMSDEELSVFLWGFEKEEICREGEFFITRRKLNEWLKQPVKE